MAFTPYSVSRTPGALPPPGAIPYNEADFTGMTPLQMSNGKTAYFMVPQPGQQPPNGKTEMEAKQELHLTMLEHLLEKMQPTTNESAPKSGMQQQGMMGGMPQPGMMMGGMSQPGMMMGGMSQPGMMMGGMPQPGMMMGPMTQPGMMMQQPMMQQPIKTNPLPHSEVLSRNGLGPIEPNVTPGNPMPQVYWR